MTKNTRGPLRSKESALEFFRKFDEELPPCRFCERVVLAGVCCQEALDQAAVIGEDANAKWLWDLDHRIWKAVAHTDPRWQRRFWYQEVGKVTDEEIAKVKELSARRYIVEPYNACMGFNFGIAVHAPFMNPDEEEFALSHGIKLRTVPLLAITGKHTDTRFEETWAKLSPLSHTPENEALLRKYGFEGLREKGYYDY